MSEYRTTNFDLAAALWASGYEPRLETKDGIVVTFIFDVGGYLSPEFMAKQWEQGGMSVPAKDLSAKSRRLRTLMRKCCEAYISTKRRETLDKGKKE